MTKPSSSGARRRNVPRPLIAIVALVVLAGAAAQAAGPRVQGAPASSPGARALHEMVDYLLGQWVGEGRGEPGEGSGGFSFEASLDGNLVTRRSHADYPAANGRPPVHHEDLMVLFPEGGQVRADYFDNEGHVIHYTAAFAPESATLTFISPIAEGQPRYRLTYRPLAINRVEVLFDVAPPGKPAAFVTYTKGICRKKEK